MWILVKMNNRKVVTMRDGHKENTSDTLVACNNNYNNVVHPREPGNVKNSLYKCEEDSPWK